MIVTRVCVILVAILVHAAAMGQEASVRPKATDGWSVGFGVGAMSPLKGESFVKGFRPALSLSLDKRISPALTLGVESTTGFDAARLPAPFLAGRTMDTYLGLFGELDFMRLVASPCSSSRWGAGIKAGAGWGHLFSGSGFGSHNYFGTSSGVFLKYNFNPRLAVTLSPTVLWNMSDATTRNSSAAYNARFARFSLLAGLKYSFGADFVCSPLYDASRVDALNFQINTLRADLDSERAATRSAIARADALQTEITALKTKQTVVKEVSVNNHLNTELMVFFLKGSGYITPDQMPNVERIALYLKNHPSATVDIKGYASSDGNVAINQRLALQRAEAVRDALVGRYGIRQARISVVGGGIGHLFDEESWNRACVCTIKN